MKTQDELLEHYWSVIVPMARDHVIKPWECVRHVNEDKFTDHPKFEGKPWNYTFALTVLEGKPVFYSDKIYSKSGETFNWNDSEYRRQLTMKGLKIATVWTWTPPPTKKRTFMLGDKELPCPDKNKGGYQISLISSRHFFSDFHDAQKVANAIDAILTEAREKE